MLSWPGMRPRAPARGLALLCLLALVPVRSARITRAGGARKVINDASNNRVLRPAGHMLTGVSTDPDLVTMLGDSYDSDRESYDPDVDDDGGLCGRCLAMKGRGVWDPTRCVCCV